MVEIRISESLRTGHRAGVARPRAMRLRRAAVPIAFAVSREWVTGRLHLRTTLFHDLLFRARTYRQLPLTTGLNNETRDAPSPGELPMGLLKSPAGKHLFLIVSLFMLSAPPAAASRVPGRCGTPTRPVSSTARAGSFDPTRRRRTTSEGQAYALFFALADNDRPTFDRVSDLDPGQSRPAAIFSTHLPAWLWGKDTDGEWKTIDPNSGLRRRCLDGLRAG